MAELEHVVRLAYSVAEAAQALGVSEHAVYQLVHSEGFPSLKIGSSWRISREGLAAWVLEEARGQKKAAGAADTGGTP